MLISEIERGPFAACQTVTEVFVALNAIVGLEAVEHLLVETRMSREELRRVAADVRRVGLADLAALMSRYARKAKPGRLTFRKRWRIEQRNSGELPGHVKHNYR
jgi:hypothetical protein